MPKYIQIAHLISTFIFYAFATAHVFIMFKCGVSYTVHAHSSHKVLLRSKGPLAIGISVELF